MRSPAGLDQLLAEAEAEPVVGWDFSWLNGRTTVDPPPWDYTALVLKLARSSPDLLDLGTGGGEWLAELAHRPTRTVATESWAPNVPIAAARLGPLKVAFVHAEGARDNAEQTTGEPSGRLPFRSSQFHLVTDRHEAFVADEVARVLASGGHFITQQIGAGSDDGHTSRNASVGRPSTRHSRRSFAAWEGRTHDGATCGSRGSAESSG